MRKRRLEIHLCREQPLTVAILIAVGDASGRHRALLEGDEMNVERPPVVPAGENAAKRDDAVLVRGLYAAQEAIAVLELVRVRRARVRRVRLLFVRAAARAEPAVEALTVRVPDVHLDTR